MRRAILLAALALGAEAALPTKWCTTGAPATWPVCNTSLSLDARAADIVSRMSIKDKVAALSSDASDFGSIGLPGYK